MKKILTFIIFLFLCNLIFSGVNYKNKIDKRILRYLKLKDKVLPGGLRVANILDEESGMLDVNIKLKEKKFVIRKNSHLKRSYSKSLVPVTPLEVELFKENIERLDGEVFSQEEGNILVCRLRLNTLKNIAQSDLVQSIKLPLRAHKEEVTTEGVYASSADSIQPLIPFRGKQNVKVCILDVGFKGYQDLLGKTLPQNVTIKSFTPKEDIEKGDFHGTACAEIVHAMAPDAELYLVNISDYRSLKKSVDWIISENIDVVSCSLGWFNVGPGNGKDVISKLAEKFSNAGILMVTSAGNSGDDHWSGVFSDKDGDGFHDFKDGSNMLKFKAKADRLISGYLKWDDWVGYDEQNGLYGESTQDYDLFLYVEEAPGKYKLIFGAGKDDNSEQKVGGRSWPTEYYDDFFSTKEVNLAIKIKKTNATRNCRLDLFLDGIYEMSEMVHSGSLTSPADSKFVLTVGAIGYRNRGYHYYSSQGPTLDGRLKPEISAYAGVSTESYAPNRFYGTSASCPHVAGAVALLMSKTPFSAFDIVEILKARAIDLGVPGPDNLTGYGALMLVR